MIGRTQTFHKRLLQWYRANRRDLPWRAPMGSQPGTLPDAYSVLVSEAMLQQTQVATVIPYFQRFLQAFPTIHRLAAADEQSVLRLWQGLGYYSRARNLRACAQAIVAQQGGKIPDAVETLKQLPGIGRYTAGAIASLAFNKRAAIVDGNVVRVICRLDGIKSDPRQRPVIDHLWQRAAALLPRDNVADFNSGLMELGATVCTPLKPRCEQCPVRKNCAAFALGKVDLIPPRKEAKPTKLNRRVVLCILRTVRRTTEVLIEQRPATGRWAGMWQFVTLDPGNHTKSAGSGEADSATDLSSLRSGAEGVAKNVAAKIAGSTTPPTHFMSLRHQLTHRRYAFEAFTVHALARRSAKSTIPGEMRWVSIDRLSDYPLPKPHVLIAAKLAAQLA